MAFNRLAKSPRSALPVLEKSILEKYAVASSLPPMEEALEEEKELPGVDEEEAGLGVEEAEVEVEGLEIEEKTEEELVMVESLEETEGAILESEQALRRAAPRSKKRFLFRFIARYDTKTLGFFLSKKKKHGKWKNKSRFFSL